MRFERRPEKNPCGDKILGIWVGTKAQAPSNEKPLIQRLYKKEISRSYQSGCMVPRKERTKQSKIKRTKERSWF